MDDNNFYGEYEMNAAEELIGNRDSGGRRERRTGPGMLNLLHSCHTWIVCGGSSVRRIHINSRWALVCHYHKNDTFFFKAGNWRGNVAGGAWSERERRRKRQKERERGRENKKRYTDREGVREKDKKWGSHQWEDEIIDSPLSAMHDNDSHDRIKSIRCIGKILSVEQ